MLDRLTSLETLIDKYCCQYGQTIEHRKQVKDKMFTKHCLIAWPLSSIVANAAKSSNKGRR